jgi:hypothetical protein
VVRHWWRWRWGRWLVKLVDGCLQLWRRPGLMQLWGEAGGAAFSSTVPRVVAFLAPV